MAGDIAGVTNLSSLSLAADLNAAGRITVPSGGSIIFASGGTVSFAGAMISMRTIGNLASLSSLAATDPNNGIMAIWQGASGLSLVLRSGNTIYTVGASAVSAAAP